MKCHLTPWLAAIALLAACLSANSARAQGYPGQPYAMPGYGAGAMQSGAMQPGGYVDPYATQQAYYTPQPGAQGQVMPAAPQAMPGEPMLSPVYQADLASFNGRCSGCSTCGGTGCPNCPQACNECGGRGCRKCAQRGHTRQGQGMGTPCGDCGGRGCGKCGGCGILSGCPCLDPCGCGGICEGCCQPRWWDFYADALYMKRENSGRSIPLGSEGIGGPIVLDSNDFDLDFEYGFRMGAALLIGIGTSIEFEYMGTLHWNDTNMATSGTNELYSAFSDFGNDADIGNAAFDDTEEASLYLESYSSDLNTFELNWRKRMVSANCRLHASFLAGVRYCQLDEDYQFYSEGRSDTLDYYIGTSNEMTGFQMGGDVWFCLHPRVLIGSDLKAGIYGNHADQVSTLTNSDGVINEAAVNDAVAFLGETNVTCIVKITPRWTLRSGIQALYLDGVALANENFNTTDPLNGRVVTINDNGSAFYYGGFGGLEFVW